MKNLLTPRQAAEYLGVHLGTLANWRYKGEGPPAVRIGRGRGHWRYRPEDLEAWLTSRQRVDEPAQAREWAEQHAGRLVGEEGEE